MEPEKGDEKTPKVPESVLKAALLRRAVEDISRLMQIRTAKQAISSLLQKGSVGDDLWQRFQRAEKEMENELRDVVMEVCLAVLQFRRVIQPLLTNLSRPTALLPTGDSLSSSRQTRSSTTPSSARSSKAFRAGPRPRGSGGRRSAPRWSRSFFTRRRRSLPTRRRQGSPPVRRTPSWSSPALLAPRRPRRPRRWQARQPRRPLRRLRLRLRGLPARRRAKRRRRRRNERVARWSARLQSPVTLFYLLWLQGRRGPLRWQARSLLGMSCLYFCTYTRVSVGGVEEGPSAVVLL